VTDVAPVRGRADVRAFIDLPFRLYRGDPMWVPPLRRDVADLLSPAHPFHEHAEVELFLARDARGAVVGRIAAVKNDAHTAEHHDGAGFFGFFECEPDAGVAHALLDTAAEWLRARGFAIMRGPASFSVNEECGLLVDGFDTPPVIMMPHNPRWYAELLESYGLAKAKDLIAYWHPSPADPARLARVADRLAERNGITIRPIDMRRFDEEVDRIRVLYNTAWQANWGAVPMTQAEIGHMAKQLKPVVIADLVVFVMVRGELAGFGLAIPNFNLVLKRIGNGRLLPFGWAKALWYARSIDQGRVLTLGVLEAYRKTGAAELLYLAMLRAAAKHGLTSGESSWILEDNTLMRRAIENTGAHAYKTYRLYDKALG
jgi:GNAT superfamily N-acetyltransferase